MKKRALAALAFLTISSSAGASFRSNANEIIAHAGGTIVPCKKVVASYLLEVFARKLASPIICVKTRPDNESARDHLDIWYRDEQISTPWEESDSWTTESILFDKGYTTIVVMLMAKSPTMIIYDPVAKSAK